jgi:hypothetical protein
MSELVADCPRCGAKEITFDVRASTVVRWEYQWQQWHEAFAICRNCHKTTVFILSDKGIEEGKFLQKVGPANVEKSLNNFIRVERYVSLRDTETTPPPEHVPENISAIFTEGATCLAVQCYNAAGTMFRLCVDLSTRAMLPEGEAAGLNQRVRRDLGLRLPWLFEAGFLPKELRELSACIREDGNDGAHAGTLKKADAEDLLDFTIALLERLYTEPARLRLAEKRRQERRGKK